MLSYLPEYKLIFPSTRYTGQRTSVDLGKVLVYSVPMPKLPNVLKTTDQLTAKQRKFVDIYVSNYGKINKADAVREAGYNPKRVNGASEIGSRLTNPNLNPHVVRYLEKKLNAELAKYEKDKLRSYKQYERMREGAIDKSQYNAAINAEKNIGQMAGFFVNRTEVQHSSLEGMSREQLEQRLNELERKIGEHKEIIDVTPESEIISS
jgi:phage terminase small subunit